MVNTLIEHQFVREVGIVSSGAGRPATMLTMNPSAGYLISCEIGVDFIGTSCADFGLNTIWENKESITPEMGAEEIVARVVDLLGQAVQKGQAVSNRYLGMAIGVAGLVEMNSGSVIFAPNLKWQGVPLLDILMKEGFQEPVFVDNEANLAALGEHYFGAGRGYKEMLYISAGVGLGGGIVNNGMIYRGANGAAAEFGHMTIEPNGEICNCGNRGCWETLVSQTALFRYIQQAIANGEQSSLQNPQENWLDNLTVKKVVQAAYADDLVAKQALQKVGRYLGIGIASLVNALNPELVLLGGVMSLASDFLLPAIREEIDRHALQWNRQAVQLAKACTESCAFSGIAAVYQSVLNDPLQV